MNPAFQREVLQQHGHTLSESCVNFIYIYLYENGLFYFCHPHPKTAGVSRSSNWTAATEL